MTELIIRADNLPFTKERKEELIQKGWTITSPTTALKDYGDIPFVKK